MLYLTNLENGHLTSTAHVYWSFPGLGLARTLKYQHKKRLQMHSGRLRHLITFSYNSLRSYTNAHVRRNTYLDLSHSYIWPYVEHALIYIHETYIICCIYNMQDIHMNNLY